MAFPAKASVQETPSIQTGNSTPSPPDDILELDEAFADAYVVAQRGELTRAEFLADRLLKRDPSYPGVWAFKAWLCAKLGHESEAEECRRHADQLSERSEIAGAEHAIGAGP